MLILLSVLHLDSGLFKEESARNKRAERISRQIEKIELEVYGDNALVQGSYYNNEDGQDKSIFCYAYDAVLLRPFFVDRFNWDTFHYISRTKNICY